MQHVSLLMLFENGNSGANLPPIPAKVAAIPAENCHAGYVNEPRDENKGACIRKPRQFSGDEHIGRDISVPRGVQRSMTQAMRIYLQRCISWLALTVESSPQA